MENFERLKISCNLNTAIIIERDLLFRFSRFTPNLEEYSCKVARKGCHARELLHSSTPDFSHVFVWHFARRNGPRRVATSLLQYAMAFPESIQSRKEVSSGTDTHHSDCLSIGTVWPSFAC